MRETRLRKAARIIEKQGLARDSFVDVEGRVCMRGAINAAWTGDPNTLHKGCVPDTAAVAEILTEHLSRCSNVVNDWARIKDRDLWARRVVAECNDFEVDSAAEAARYLEKAAVRREEEI